MALWEWQRSSSMAPEVEYRYDAPTITVDPDTDEETLVFPDPLTIIRKKPMRVANFKARGYTDEEAQAIFDQVEAGDLDFELDDHLGQTWTGEIGNVSENPVDDGGTVYLELSLTLNKAVKSV